MLLITTCHCVVADLRLSPQVNLAQNNNKFYAIQLLEKSGQLLLFTRYGRVGEVGKTEQKPGTVKDFEKKYKSKTKNAWVGPHDPNFEKKPKVGPYRMWQASTNLLDAMHTFAGSRANGPTVRVVA